MGFAISTQQLPRLRSHEAAAAYWNGQRQVRGRDPSIRPLRVDGKYVDRFHIRMDSAGVVYCRMHSTDLIVFHPNGVVHVDLQGWSTRSTFDFIGAVLGADVRAFALNQKGISTNEGYVRITHAGIRLQPATTRGWELVHPDDPAVLFVQNVCDRKKANEVKKAAKPFLSWVQAREALGTPIWPQYAPRHRDSEILGGLSSHDEGVLPAWDLAALYATSADHYIDRALVSSGAVAPVTLPLGEVPKRNRWNPVGALIL